MGTTDIYLNRIYDNLIGISFQNYVSGTTNSGVINAVNNWWGKNTEPTISTTATAPTTATDIWKANGTGTLNYNPWLVLNATANPTSIFTGETSTITADLTKNSNGQDTTTIYPGKFVPNGIPVTFVHDLLGTVNPVNTNITNGIANTTFTAGSVPGNSTIVAKVDGMDGTTPAKTVNTTVTLTVNPLPTAIEVNSTTGYKGDVVNLVATLTDTKNSVPVSGETINFTVNGNSVGSATTDASGVATLAYTIQQDAGNYTILAEFLGDANYLVSSNTETLTVNHIPTAILVSSITGYNGDEVNLTATLTDTHNNIPVSGKTIDFTVNGVYVGSGVTNASGVAKYTYKIVQDAGSYTILAEFQKDSVYAASSNTETLTVKPIPVTIDIKPGETPNTININSNGVIPVAILTTSTFDASTVNPSSVTFGHSGAEKSLVKWTWTDVNGDGKLDLLLHFDTKKSKLLPSDNEAILKGLTTGGLTFEGRDSIKTVSK